MSAARVRHGAYCFGDVWATYTAEERTSGRAVSTTPGPVALSHTTALLAHGIAVWGADLSRVHVTTARRGAARDRARRASTTWASARRQKSSLVDGMPVVVPARAVIEAATVLSLESALVSADSALFRRATDPDRAARACSPG